MNFVPTPFAARQLISHGCILVNGHKVNVKSTLLKPGDCVEVSKKAWPRVFNAIEDRFKEAGFIRPVPNYLEVSFGLLKGVFLHEPRAEEVHFNFPVALNLVKEYYKI